MSSRIAAIVLLGLVLLASPSRAETFAVQPIAFCTADDPYCGFSSALAFDIAVRRSFGEVNLEFRPTGISFEPLPTRFELGDRWAALDSNKGLAKNGEKNTDLAKEIAADPTFFDEKVITIFLFKSIAPRWSGVPCPGTEKDLKRVNASYLRVPNKNDALEGRQWAHELGHYWCLRHPFTQQDMPEYLAPLDDVDAMVCGTPPSWNFWTVVNDTDPDPGSMKRWAKAKDGDPQTPITNREDTRVPLASGDSDVGQHRDLHRWCVPSKSAEPVDFAPDQPAHSSHCDITCTQAFLSGLPPNVSETTTTLPHQPLTSTLMSYYDKDQKCRGPFVIDGERIEAFTPDQADVVRACRAFVPDRIALEDLCDGIGNGDSDHDGKCNNVDKCPYNADTLGKDFDLDGTPDACDPCPFTPFSFALPNGVSPDGDIDGDGWANACDPDMDADGCANCDPGSAGCVGTHFGDQHPAQSQIPVGEAPLPACATATEGPEFMWEGEDEDGDTLLNCEDYDDDNDSIPDSGDPCSLVPTTPGEELCYNLPTSVCPLDLDLAARCRLGQCGLFEITVESSNPDPTTTLHFPTFDIIGDSLYLGRLGDHTLSESAEALRGAMPLPGGHLPQGQLLMLVREKASGRVVSELARYEAGEVRFEASMRGTFLHVRFPRAGGAPSVAPTWALGVPAGSRFRDGDGDGVPDSADNCLTAPNPEQGDVDQDGAGNACDGDVDGDWSVDERDLEVVLDCRGVDLSRPEMEEDDEVLPSDIEASDDSSGRSESSDDDLRLREIQDRCVVADLDADGFVDDRDLEVVLGLLGGVVGPSGVTTGPFAACDFQGDVAVCGPDRDGDRVQDLEDNCPADANRDQADGDRDGVGDACEPTCVTVGRGLVGDIADTQIYDDPTDPTRADKNYGSAWVANTGVPGESGQRMGLFAFDLRAVPAGAEVVSARLAIHPRLVSTTQTLRAHRVTAPWSELAVTWRSFGGAFDAAVAASGSNGGAGNLGPIALDVSALVRSWVAGDAPNDGLVLMQDGPGFTHYWTSEAAVSDRPTLEVCYQ